MPRIDLPASPPRNVSLFAFRPESARPLRDLAEAVPRGRSATYPAIAHQVVDQGYLGRESVVTGAG